MTLSVYRSGILIGTLTMQAGDPFYGFTYANSYLSASDALPLSLSLPLSSERFSGIQALPYFEGLLPEGQARDAIARQLGISRTSSAKLLKELGQDCAGDVAILEEGESPSADTIGYIRFEEGLRTIAERPFETISQLQEETRLSLAGGQEKIALYHKEGSPLDEDWFIPENGSPSTHILKPGVLDDRYPNLTLNEFLCMRAARECGIDTATVDLLFPGNPLLIVERYDRYKEAEVPGELPVFNRLHQEDCCQARGVSSEFKYEHDGGPGFGQIRNLLVRHALSPSETIASFARLGLFNYLIGNCDAHAKNYSLMQLDGAMIALAPAYDLHCTAIYDGRFGAKLSRSLGMRIGDHENIDKVDSGGFTLLAKDLHIRPRALEAMFDELADALASSFEIAGTAAASAGFEASSEMVERIIADAQQRISKVKRSR